MSHKIVQKSTQFKTYLQKMDETRLIYAGGSTYSLPKAPIRSLHYHQLYEVGVCKNGIGLWCTPECVSTIAPGDTVLMPPGCPHYSRAIDGCGCDFIYFDAAGLLAHSGIDLSDILEKPRLESPLIFKKHTSPKLCGVLESMVEHALKATDKDDRIAAHLFSILLLDHPSEQKTIPSKTDSKLFPAIEKIIGGFSLDLTLDELAYACSMSPNWFLKRFRDEYGTTPIKYLNDFRTSIASELLIGTDKPITEIASFCGYNAPSDLFRHFRASFGISPTEYRKKRE